MNREDILSTLRDVAVEVLGVEADAVTEQASFKDDLDADSLDLVEVVMALEEKLDIAIPEEELADIKTVGQAIDVVVSKVAARA
ncbi:MAG TPA: acyl carrier protein [Acidimicrobiales bacterium]|nr:acyl carrier protein [Acidimicrobiales bacterium]